MYAFDTRLQSPHHMQVDVMVLDRKGAKYAAYLLNGMTFGVPAAITD